MKYCSLALAVALTVAPVASFSAGPLSLRRDTTTALWASTLEERQTSDAAAAAAAPVRVAPGAGWEPEWENRPGKTNFLDSDPTQPDLSEMWECPLTRWDSNGYVDGRRSTVDGRCGWPVEAMSPDREGSDGAFLFLPSKPLLFL